MRLVFYLNANNIIGIIWSRLDGLEAHIFECFSRYRSNGYSFPHTPDRITFNISTFHGMMHG